MLEAALVFAVTALPALKALLLGRLQLLHAPHVLRENIKIAQALLSAMHVIVVDISVGRGLQAHWTVLHVGQENGARLMELLLLLPAQTVVWEVGSTLMEQLPAIVFFAEVVSTPPS